MWSHAINDASLGSGVEDVFPENVSCRRCERASSDQDARQSFSVSSVYELPFTGRIFGGLATFGGWDWPVAGTGLPVNITVDRAAAAMPDGNSGNQRPNYVSGMSFYPPAARLRSTGSISPPSRFRPRRPGGIWDAMRFADPRSGRSTPLCSAASRFASG